MVSEGANAPSGFPLLYGNRLCEGSFVSLNLPTKRASHYKGV